MQCDSYWVTTGPVFFFTDGCIAFWPYFFHGDVVVMLRRVHVQAALSDAPHPRFLGLSEEKSCRSYAEKYSTFLAVDSQSSWLDFIQSGSGNPALGPCPLWPLDSSGTSPEKSKHKRKISSKPKKTKDKDKDLPEKLVLDRPEVERSPPPTSSASQTMFTRSNPGAQIYLGRSGVSWLENA
jgi:hypothetical protein